MAHYESTAEEILESLNDNVDMVVIGAGTGGERLLEELEFKGVFRNLHWSCQKV